MSAWLRNSPATNTDSNTTTMLRTIARAITLHLRCIELTAPNGARLR